MFIFIDQNAKSKTDAEILRQNDGFITGGELNPLFYPFSASRSLAR